MKNIENYKRRFYTLMESTMGNVKPLISEQSEPIDIIYNTPMPNSFVDDKDSAVSKAIKGATDYLDSKKDGGGLDMYSKIYQYLEEKLERFGDMRSNKVRTSNQPRPRWNLSWNCKPPFYSGPDESKDWAAYIRPSYIDNSSGKVDGAELYLFFKKKSDIEHFITKRLGQPDKKNTEFDYENRKYQGLMYILKSQNDAQDAAYVISQIIAPKY